jgi:hypothetical protein
MDVHADSVKVSVFAANAGEPTERFEVVPDDRGLARLVRRLKAYGAGVRCVYEAGPCGNRLQRFLSARGVICEVAAPSLIPRKPGEKVKTDRRDADKLGRLYRAGELTLVAVAKPGLEALRDLVRARGGRQRGSVASAASLEQVSPAPRPPLSPWASLDSKALLLDPLDPV